MGEISHPESVESLQRLVELQRNRIKDLLASETDLQRQIEVRDHFLNELFDPNPCTLDHHGDCQEHGYFGGECPMTVLVRIGIIPVERVNTFETS